MNDTQIEMAAHYDNDNHIVVVDSEEEGEVTTENVRKATQMAMELSRQHHCDHLLFDITRMKQVQTILQGFLDMKDVSQTTGLTLQHKCAIIFNPALYSEERARFIETVVANRPNPMLKIFRIRRDAVNWLKEL